MSKQIDDKRLTLVVDREYKIYAYKPSLFRMFYRNYEKQTPQRFIRFLFELHKGYTVYYLEKDENIVAYSVVSKGGGRYHFAENSDIVVGPYFVLEEYRGNHYSEILVSEILNHIETDYRYAFDWVKKTNEPSLKCSDRVGFRIVNTADIIPPLRKIVVRNNDSGEYYILRMKKPSLSAED